MNRISKSIDGYIYLCHGNETRDYAKNNLILYIEKYLNPTSIILDIGANIGTCSIPMSNKNRKIYSFEPYTDSFQALCGNIFINNKTNITPLHFALTDSTNVNISPEEINSKILMDGNKKINETYRPAQINRSHFMLKTLDSFDFEKIDFIKLDSKGHELNVLMGGVNTILKYKPIILFECWSLDSICWTSIPNTYRQLMDYITYNLCYNIHKIEIDKVDGIDNYEAIPTYSKMQ
jgi:FkbM family methyltransferase